MIIPSVKAWASAVSLLCIVVLTISFQNCSKFSVAKLNVTSGSSYCTGNTADPICTASIVPTCSFNGAAVSSGAKVTAFLTSTVASGSACQSETRTCKAGTLSGSYTYASCAVGAAASCLFNGATIASGANTTAYLSSSDATCQPQTRTCTNGVLSGSYAYGTCAVAVAQSCLFNGQTITNGKSVSAFATSQVASGQKCTPMTRTCFNGALSGSGDFASCSVAAEAAACLFNGATVPSGASVTGYGASSVAFGQSCGAQTRTCSNGTLSGSGDFASCSVNAAASCLINGQTIPDGGSISLYLSASVGSGQNCTTENRVCSNGTLSGSATAASCSPSAILCGADVVNNPNVDASPSLQACLNTSSPVIELVAGRYYLNSQIVFSNRSNVTVQTQGVTDGAACLNGGPACAILTANQNHGGPTILDSYSSTNVMFRHIALDGNIALRRILHANNDWPGGIAYNARIHDCDHCSFIGFASVRAPQGTALEYNGDYATFDYCLFRDNGWGMMNHPGSAAWSDGLTMIGSTGVHITNSIFKDNSDIDLILGNGVNAVVQSNWIGNTYNFAFGALMLDNFGGATTGDYSGAIISNNTIDCGQGYCGLGINVGPHMWYAAPNVIGGSIYANTVVGARQGILTNGASGWDIYGNSVGVLGIYTDGTYSTNFISYTAGDSVNIHDNSVAAAPSGLVGMPPQNLWVVLSNFAGTRAEVSQAYRDVLGRDPDISGGPTFTAQMNAGASVSQIRTALAQSAEGVAMINKIYQRTLQRPADAAGLANWQNYLINGGAVPQMWWQFETTPEGAAATYSF